MQRHQKSAPAVPRSDFPFNSGVLQCDGPAWLDTEQGQETEAIVNRSALTGVLHDRWLLMIGDSSMRMFFHFIVGVLSLGWAE